MGFDIECIIDIHSYPGEYFCPVCRTLVYPNEAFQSQCTHLYCKPCLVHIANGTRACPYDGYLVTESDSKPLINSDKALAENIGKVKVHCLYFRSGCTWEGTLSDCTSHCSGCSFGNSPVICNRCGIQIVHRQVHDHAQTCPGVYEGQQAVVGVSGISRSGTTSSTVTAAANQTVGQSGAPASLAQNPQNVAANPLSGQNINMQVNPISHAPVVAPVAVPGPEQWYQQQYQQYYQQYVGYDAYGQPHQQYYALQQQQPSQHYQQHPVQVQGQLQSHAYSQAVPQPQPQQQLQPQSQPQPQLQTQTQTQAQPLLSAQPQQQPNPVPQAPQQTHFQQQAQGQAQSQPQPQPQFQLLHQAQPQAQLAPQGQAQAHAPSQTLAPNYQPNLHQQPHLAMRPQTQIPPQVLPPGPPPPHSQSNQPSQFPQSIGVRPPAQHAQVPQHQQNVQMHHLQASHSLVQPLMHPQAPSYSQISNQSNVQMQPQAQTYHSMPQPPTFQPQANQSTAPATLPLAPPPPIPPVGGHHSYQQPLPAQKMQSGAAAQQHQMQPPASGSLHPAQVHNQVPHQPALMRPPHSHGSFSQQQPSTLFPPQSQVPGIPLTQHQQFIPHVQQPAHPIQHRPVMQPVQQAPPQNYAQQQQFLAPFQGELHQQGQLTQQQPVQSQMRLSGPPQPHQSQSYVGRPMMPNQGIHPQSHQLSSGGFGNLAHSGPAPPASTQSSLPQNYAKSAVLEHNATVVETRSPSKERAEKKGFEGESLKEEIGTGQDEAVLKDSNDAAKDGLLNSVLKQEKGDLNGASEQASGGRSFEAGGAEDEFRKEDVHSLSDSTVAGQSFASFDKQSLSAVSASSTEVYVLPPQSHGSHQERSQVLFQGQFLSVVGPQGPGALPHSGQSLNLAEGKMPGSSGGPPRSFEAQPGSQRPGLTTLADPHGMIGRAPSIGFEGQYGPQHVKPSEVAISGDHMPRSGDRAPFTKTHADDSNILRMDGARAPDSSVFGSRDENLTPLYREHSNFFPREPSRNLEQASRPFDKPLHGPSYDDGSKLDPGALGPRSRFVQHHPSSGHGHGDVFGPGPEFAHHHIKPLAHRSPGRDYFGSSPRGYGGPSNFPRGAAAYDDINSREAHRFGEGSRSFHFSSDTVGNPFHDSRFPPFPGHLRRDDNIDGPGNPRFGEHRAPGLLHNQNGGDDAFGPDGPGHYMRGKFSGPGYLPSHFSMGETAGPGTFVGHGRLGEGAGTFPRLPFSEFSRGDVSGLHFGEAAMRNNYSFHGFPNDGKFSGGLDSFDYSRKRKPISIGWCRICELDCETVEGLEMHSQTKEHQNMAMNMVKSIKLKSKKKQRASAGHKAHEGGSRSRKGATVGRGSKP